MRDNRQNGAGVGGELAVVVYELCHPYLCRAF